MSLPPSLSPPFESRFPTRIHLLDVAGRQIELVAPFDPDTLLDDPVTEARYKADDYLPYWPIIWPSGLMMAERILLDEGMPPVPPTGGGGKCIDLGCGLGVTGIAAGLRGWDVTLTDYDPEAIEFARHNALRNGVPAERIRAVNMDWRQPLPERFSWVVASDVLYERRLHPLLLGAIEALMAPGGCAWVSDPHRTSAEDFPLAAVTAGFRCAATELKGKNFHGGEQPGTLYVLTRP